MLRIKATSTSTRALQAGGYLAFALLMVAPAAASRSGVDWLPWSESSWAQAKQGKSLVLVHIARRGDPLTAEMDRTAFSHPSVRELLADGYVCMRVDADDHPGVAATLGSFVFETQQERGLPINVWFTPDGLPISGRTFLMPTDEWGKPGLLSLLERLARRQRDDPASLRSEAEGRLRRFLTPPAPGEADLATVHDEAIELLALTFGNQSSGGPAASPVLPLAWRYLVQQAEAGNADADFIWDFLTEQLSGPHYDPGSARWVQRRGHDPAQPDLHLSAGAALAYLDAARATNRPDFSGAARRMMAALAAHLKHTAAPFDARAHAVVALFAGAAYFADDAWHAEASRRRAELAAIVGAELRTGTTLSTSPRALAAVRATLHLTPSNPSDKDLILRIDEALAPLRDERGLLVFPLGTALPKHTVVDLLEDGIRPSANAWLIMADSKAETWWRRHGRTVAAAPDLHPALLHVLHGVHQAKPASSR